MSERFEMVFPDGEREAAQTLADEQRMTLSAYIRALLNAVQHENERTAVRRFRALRGE